MEKKNLKGEKYELAKKLAIEELQSNAKVYPKSPVDSLGNEIAKKNLIRPIAGDAGKRALRDLQQLGYDRDGNKRANEKKINKIVGPNYVTSGGHKIEIHGYSDGKNTFMEKNKHEQNEKRILTKIDTKPSTADIKAYKNSVKTWPQEISRISPKLDTPKEISTDQKPEKKPIDAIPCQDKKITAEKPMRDIKPKTEALEKKLKK